MKNTLKQQKKDGCFFDYSQTDNSMYSGKKIIY